MDVSHCQPRSFFLSGSVKIDLATLGVLVGEEAALTTAFLLFSNVDNLLEPLKASIQDILSNHFGLVRSARYSKYRVLPEAFSSVVRGLRNKGVLLNSAYLPFVSCRLQRQQIATVFAFERKHVAAAHNNR